MPRPSKKKPLAPSLEQEAKAFTSKTKNTPPKRPKEVLSPLRTQLAASILGGLIAGGGGSIRAKELVDEAYRYADLLIQYED